MKTNTINNTLAIAIQQMQRPGPWAEWDASTPLDQFLLELHSREAVFVEDPTGRRSGWWDHPAQQALRGIPFLYRNASRTLLAQQLLAAMGIGEHVDGIEVSRKLHERLDLIRASMAAVGWTRLDGEFAEATTVIEVPHTAPWQDAWDAEPTAEGSKMTVSVSLEEAFDEFCTELGKEGMTGSKWAVIDVATRLHLPQLEDRSWDAVILDSAYDKAQAKEKLAKLSRSGGHRLFATNWYYRQLVKQQWKLESLISKLESDLDRKMRRAERPYSETYAGDDEQQLIQIGRISHMMCLDHTDEHGQWSGDPEQEAIKIAQEELDDLQHLIRELEKQQSALAPVWRLINGEGVPFWYQDQQVFFTINQKPEALAARANAMQFWIAARAAKVADAVRNDPKVLALLAELANFDNL